MTTSGPKVSVKFRFSFFLSDSRGTRYNVGYSSTNKLQRDNLLYAYNEPMNIYIACRGQIEENHSIS